MNKILFFILAVFVASNAWANEVQVFIPGYQIRYENDEDQSIRNRNYENYNLAVVYDKYLLGAEFNKNETESTSGAIALTTKYQEYNLYAGYLLLTHTLHEDYKISVETGPLIFLGQNRATVQTTVGTVSEQSVGEDNLNIALGAQGSLRINFLIVQADLRYAYSRSYEPSYVVIYGLRIGLRIGF